MAQQVLKDIVPWQMLDPIIEHALAVNKARHENFKTRYYAANPKGK